MTGNWQFSLSRKGRTIVVRSEKTKKILHRFAMNSGNKISNRFCSFVSWNCFLGHLLKLANDRGTTIHSVLFGGISHHQCKSDIARTKSNFIGLPLLHQRLSRQMYPT
jgi:hypothetical protein